MTKKYPAKYFPFDIPLLIFLWTFGFLQKIFNATGFVMKHLSRKMDGYIMSVSYFPSQYHVYQSLSQ